MIKYIVIQQFVHNDSPDYIRLLKGFNTMESAQEFLDKIQESSSCVFDTEMVPEDYLCMTYYTGRETPHKEYYKIRSVEI